MAQLVTRKELAALAGVAMPSITKAAQKRFPSACVGPRVDLDHPDVQSYLAGRARPPTRNDAQPAQAPTNPPEVRRSTNVETAGPEPDWEHIQDSDAPHEVTKADVGKFAHWTLEALTRKFGTSTAFRDWLDARKRIADVREKELKIEEREGRLIPRELVRTHVFSHLDSAYRRLLQDAAATIARTVYSASRSGQSVEEAEALVRGILTLHLRPLKANTVKILRGEAA